MRGTPFFAFAAFAPDAGFALGGYRFPGADSRRSAFGVDAGFPMRNRSFRGAPPFAAFAQPSSLPRRGAASRGAPAAVGVQSLETAASRVRYHEEGGIMQIITDQVYEFSKDNKPCATAKPGEVLQFNTQDCFSNRIPDENTTMADLDYTYGFANPAAGPVYIEGAEPGDVLVVDIYEVKVADEGTIATDDHCGPLFETTGYRTKKIPIKDGMATFNQVSFPINPMIGVIGTAPSGPDVIDGFVGSHGGNMDNKKITKGTRLYFPVRVPGALLQMGDVHATMGDAELCGTGIEIPAEITVRVQLVKDFELNWPVLETFGPDGKWYVNCSGTHYEQALMNGSKELQRLLIRVTGWDAVETYMYMSVQSDVEVSQGCEPCEVDVSLRIGTPKLSEFPVLIPQP